MWVRSSSNRQTSQDPEWLKELSKVLNSTGNGEELEMVRTLYYQTYFEYVEEGMPSDVAIHKSQLRSVFYFSRNRKGGLAAKMRCDVQGGRFALEGCKLFRGTLQTSYREKDNCFE